MRDWMRRWRENNSIPHTSKICNFYFSCPFNICIIMTLFQRSITPNSINLTQNNITDSYFFVSPQRDWSVPEDPSRNHHMWSKTIDFYSCYMPLKGSAVNVNRASKVSRGQQMSTRSDIMEEDASVCLISTVPCDLSKSVCVCVRLKM